MNQFHTSIAAGIVVVVVVSVPPFFQFVFIAFQYLSWVGKIWCGAVLHQFESDAAPIHRS